MRSDKTRKIPVIYSELYYVDIGDHVFPAAKYRILKKRIVLDSSLEDKYEIISPKKIKDKDLLLVHTSGYVNRLKTGELSAEEMVALEIPFSEALVGASLICCGGTYETAKCALKSRAAIHLGGGFHHAFPDHGEGFCALNDIAVSIRALQDEDLAKKALVIDCDLHQGNGTAFIFHRDPTVFTFSIHQENNYPFHKPKGDMDIGLRDYTRDKVYLQHLYDNIPKIISSFKPDIILYLAGADPYEGDQLGNLALSKEGLRDRDDFIFTQALNFDVPIAVTLAGGYAARREDTVDIHFATVKECIKIFVG